MLAVGSLLVLGGLIGIVVTIVGLVIHKIGKSETKASFRPLWLSLAAFVVGLILIPNGSAKPDKEPTVSVAKPLPDGFTADASFDPNSESSRAVLSVLQARCPAMMKGRSSLEQAKFTRLKATDPAFAYDGNNLPFVPDGLHWNVVDRLTFRVTESASGPFQQARGNVCELNFGGGAKPGILATKSVCATLCDQVNFVTGGNYFGDEPRLQILEAKEVARAATTSRVDANERERKQLERTALAGDYQARRNLAFGYQQGDFSTEPDYVTACAWREIIIESGDEQVDNSDASNREYACGRLPPGDEARVKALKRQFKRGP